jgi:hypothetical protein
MAHMSNRERIARAAEEARLAAAEKSAKKVAREADGTRPKRAPKPPPRVKIVWEVCTGGGTVVKTFAYPDKAAAENEIARLAKAGRSHVLRATKVPME